MTWLAGLRGGIGRQMVWAAVIALWVGAAAAQVATTQGSTTQGTSTATAGAQPVAATGGAASRNLAPGFQGRSGASTLVIVPADIELFSISAGGVMEPKADWTEAASRHFRAGLHKRAALLGPKVVELGSEAMDELAELNALHGAVAQSIFIHHMMGHSKLPTKNDQLDWSLGDAVQTLRERTRADYALFTWIRDSYASAERKATMVMFALLGVGIAGGSQIGYASLVDLRDGRVVWFNNLLRASGDLREEQPAQETLDLLLKGIPAAQ